MMFHRNIKAIRECLGVSRADFAQRVGCTHSQLKCWEQGTTEPSIHFINRISEELQVDADILMRGSLYAYTSYGLRKVLNSGTMKPRPKIG